MRTDTILNTDAFDKHTQQALVLSLFESLKAGENFLVLSQLEPEALCQELDQLAQPDLQWEFVDKSPRCWKLRIRKKKLTEV